MIGEQYGIASALNNLGVISGALGEYAEAEQLYQESLKIRQDMGDHWGAILSLRNLGAATSTREEYEASKRYYLEALRMAMEIQDGSLALQSLVELAVTHVKAREHEQALAILAFAIHCHEVSEEIKENADHLLAELASQLPSDVITVALERGKTQKLEAVAADLLQAPT
jgi:tetratricopeptide (TPR) repeat protein